MTSEQLINEERFTAHATQAILKLLEGQPARLAISILEGAKDMIHGAALENAVRTEACLDTETSGMTRWWLAKDQSSGDFEPSCAMCAPGEESNRTPAWMANDPSRAMLAPVPTSES